MKRLPAALVAIRALCGPVLLAAVLAAWPGAVAAGLVTLAFVSDVADGILARRIGVATEALRRADSIVDVVFYACAFAALVARYPEAVRAHAVGIGAVVALEVARAVLERAKFGRLAAYHMMSAKAWGIALWLGFCEVFLTGGGGILFETAIVLGIVADTEGLAASIVLSTWRHDVPSLWHAVRIERDRRGAA